MAPVAAMTSGPASWGGISAAIFRAIRRSFRKTNPAPVVTSLVLSLRGGAQGRNLLGLIGRDMPLGPITNASGARFEPQKMSWLGTPTTETNVCIAMKAAKVKSVQDLFTTELVVGDVGPGSGTSSYAGAEQASGTKFKLVSGYPSSSDVFLAMERGEVEGICESLDSIEDRRPNWIARGEVDSCSRVLRSRTRNQGSLRHRPCRDLAPEGRASLPLCRAGHRAAVRGAPAVPAATLAMFRDAFSATMRGTDFIAEAARQKFRLRPHDGAYRMRSSGKSTPPRSR